VKVGKALFTKMRITLAGHQLMGIEKKFDRTGLTRLGKGMAHASFDGTNTTVEVRPLRPVYIERDVQMFREVFGDTFLGMAPVTHS